MGTIVAPPRRSCPTRSRTSKSTHTMRPKCLILLVAAAAMVVVSPSLSAAKSNQHCGPFLIDASTPVAVRTSYRGVEDVSDPTGRRGDEITFVVNTTSPSFALKFGPTLRNFFTFELSDASDTIRLPQEPGRPPYPSWPESLNYMKLRLVSKNSNLLNGTFELGPSGSPASLQQNMPAFLTAAELHGMQFDLCSSVSDYLIRGSKPYRNATESTAGTDLAPGDDRTRSGSNIKWRAGDGDARKRGHFPVTVEVVMRIKGQFMNDEEVTVTAPKLFSFAAHTGKPWLNAAGLRMMRDATPECNGGNFAGPGQQSNWLKEEFGMDDVRCEHDPACLL